ATPPAPAASTPSRPAPPNHGPDTRRRDRRDSSVSQVNAATSPHPTSQGKETDVAVADALDRATYSQWDWVAEQTRTYLASGGTEGHEANGVRMLVLVTTGRASGQPRRTCLIYGTSGDDFVLVASKGGADEHPDWFHNLQAG